MIPLVHVWRDDFGETVIPPQLATSTTFRKDGLPDARCRVSNRPFLLWLDEMRPIPYCITPAGKAHLEGKAK